MRLVQATGFPLRIERRGKAGIGRGAVDVVLHVFLARPGDFHRRGELLRKLDGIDDEVRFAAASKPATEKRGMDEDRLGPQARNFRGIVLRSGLRLRRRPHVAALRLDVRRAVHGLHGGVREERRLVDGVEFLAPRCP